MNNRKYTQVITIDEDRNITDVLHNDFWILLNEPMIISNGDNEREVIEKDVILCDICNEINPEYVEHDDKMLYNALCKSCLEKTRQGGNEK